MLLCDLNAIAYMQFLISQVSQARGLDVKCQARLSKKVYEFQFGFLLWSVVYYVTASISQKRKHASIEVNLPSDSVMLGTIFFRILWYRLISTVK